MTPFGKRVRELRKLHNVTLKDMAENLNVSSAYLSSLEHGKRGRPSWYLIQKIIAYFNVIWDDAEDLVYLARISHPRIKIDTEHLSPTAVTVSNVLADKISNLSETELQQILKILQPNSKE